MVSMIARVTFTATSTLLIISGGDEKSKIEKMQFKLIQQHRIILNLTECNSNQII